MVFVYSILGGMACAFVFDIFRIVRRIQHKISAVQVFVQDLMFFILLAVILFITYLLANDADVRGYEFAGTLLGAVIYFVVISRVLTRIILFLIETFGIVLEKVLKVVLFPLVVLFRIFKRPARFIVLKLDGLFVRLRKKCKAMALYLVDCVKKIFVISKKI